VNKHSQSAVVRDDAYYDRLSAQLEDDDFELPADALVHPGNDDGLGRAYLAPHMTAEELDAATHRGRGRPRLSGTGFGHSTKRQVRLSDEVDAALVRLANEQGRTPSAVMRQAIEDYLRTA
jgi:hypothetical protein